MNEDDILIAKPAGPSPDELVRQIREVSQNIAAAKAFEQEATNKIVEQKERVDAYHKRVYQLGIQRNDLARQLFEALEHTY